MWIVLGKSFVQQFSSIFTCSYAANLKENRNTDIYVASIGSYRVCIAVTFDPFCKLNSLIMI